MNGMRAAARAIRAVTTERCAEELRAPPRDEEHLIGASPAMQRLRDTIRRVATSTRPALVVGPTGAGKELVVRALHASGAGPDAPLLDVNCGAIPETLFESHLFGHERGAFTGAERRHEGAFASTGGGTLFLDEIGELTLAHQAKLLRVLETGRFRAVGSQVEQAFQGRVVAATHVDLAALVSQRRFREDLYYRLHVLVVRVPSLAEHPEDIPALVEHFVRRSGRALRFTDAALADLQRRAWSGNVRELRNLVDRLAVLSERDEVTPAELTEVAASSSAVAPVDATLACVVDAALALDAPRALDAVVEGMIAEAMRRAGGNKTAAARMLGLHRKSLERRLARRRG